MPPGVYERRRLHPNKYGRFYLAWENKDAIIADRKSGLSLSAVASKHNVSVPTVCKLMNGKGWNPGRTVRSAVRVNT